MNKIEIKIEKGEKKILNIIDMIFQSLIVHEIINLIKIIRLYVLI
jgi:hypothetical protein